MLIHYGIHRFGLKKTGVRKDFCNACHGECIAELYESFDWGYIFYIPLVPLGRKQRWLCTLCHQNPRGRYTTGKFTRIISLFLLPVLIYCFLTMGGVSQSMLFICGVLFVAWLSMLYKTIKPKQEPNDAERRREIIPLSREACFYCKGLVSSDHNPHCSPCNISIYTD